MQQQPQKNQCRHDLCKNPGYWKLLWCIESANYTADKIAGSNQFIIQRKSIDGVGVSLQGMSYIFKKSIPDFTVTQSFPNESGIGEYSYTLQPGVDYTYTPTQVDKFKVDSRILPLKEPVTLREPRIVTSTMMEI